MYPFIKYVYTKDSLVSLVANFLIRTSLKEAGGGGAKKVVCKVQWQVTSIRSYGEYGPLFAKFSFFNRLRQRKTAFTVLQSGQLTVQGILNDNLNIYILLELREKRQDTNLPGFDVKTILRHFGPCLLNFHFSTDQGREKRFSQS